MVCGPLRKKQGLAYVQPAHLCKVGMLWVPGHDQSVHIILQLTFLAVAHGNVILS